MKKLRLGIIGCGQIAHSHAAAINKLNDDFELSAVIDQSQDQVHAFAKKYGVDFCGTQFDELYSQNLVDAVIVASPNALHQEHTLTALDAGIHVLVEKPVAETSEDAARMQAAAKQNDRVLAVGHTFRHSRATLELMAKLKSFGKLIAIEISQCVFWDGPKVTWWANRTPSQGLIVPMFASHAVDFIYMVTGAEPIFINAIAARHQSTWQAEDEVMLQMSFANRVIASAHLSYNQRHVVDRKVLYFDQGVAEIENGVVLRWNGEPLVDESHTVDDPHSMGGRDLSGFFEMQLIAFKKAIAGEKSHIALAEDGLALMRMQESIMHSIRQNSVELID